VSSVLSGFDLKSNLEAGIFAAGFSCVCCLTCRRFRLLAMDIFLLAISKLEELADARPLDVGSEENAVTADMQLANIVSKVSE
jgi:hypothetical protein